MKDKELTSIEEFNIADNTLRDKFINPIENPTVENYDLVLHVSDFIKYQAEELITEYVNP